MSNYLPDGQKRNRIFRKCELEFLRTVKRETDAIKIEKALEKFLIAKIRKNGYGNEYLHHDNGSLEDKIKEWFSKSSEELVEEYRRKKSNQTILSTPLRGATDGWRSEVKWKILTRAFLFVGYSSSQLSL